jgi:hypothetical protein
MEPPKRSIRKTLVYVSRAKSARNHPTPRTHVRNLQVYRRRKKKRNNSRLCFSLPPLIPKPITQSLHLTTLSKEDFGRVSRTFIHNGVVVSCSNTQQLALLSS